MVLLKHQVLKSLAWLAIFKYAGQIITWAITIYVIRILNPADYGLMAQAYVFVGFLAMLSEFGIGVALVQAKEIDLQLLKEFFGFVVSLNCLLAGLLFIGAPLLSAYFKEPLLIEIFRVLSSVFILLGLYSIPQSIILRNMEFRLKAKVDFLAAIGAALVTLALALSGYGVWALVIGTLSTHVILVLGYNCVGQSVLVPSFSFKKLRSLISFGGYLTGSRLLWYFYTKADIVISGRFLSNETLGVYSVAMNLSSLPLEKFFPIVNQVAFPAYSKIQSDITAVQKNLLKSIRLISIFLFPVFFGLFAIAPDLIILLLGTEWAEVILPFQILCLIMPLRGLRSLFAPMLNGIGRPDIEFYNVILTAIIMPICFVIGIYWGLIGLSLAWLIGYSGAFLITSNRCLKVVKLRMYHLVREVKKPFVFSVCMLLGVKVLSQYMVIVNFISIGLISSTLAGVIIYCFLFFLFDRKSFNEYISLFLKKGSR